MAMSTKGATPLKRQREDEDEMRTGGSSEIQKVELSIRTDFFLCLVFIVCLFVLFRGGSKHSLCTLVLNSIG